MGHSVRLACLRHAASVHPEPGSNSPKKNNNLFILRIVFLTLELTFLLSFQRSFLLFLKAILIYQILDVKSILNLNFF